MPYVDNIVKSYRAATADDHAQGIAWYGVAGEFAAALPVDTRTAAGVIAALSPMMSWPANITAARRVIAAYVLGEGSLTRPPEGCGLKRNVAKAWRILYGEDPNDVLSGPKVRAFFANIMGDPTAVTVDRWAARIARGNADDPGTVTAREYREMAAAYVEAAERLDITPRDLQAAVWVYFRRVHARSQYAALDTAAASE